MVTENNSIPISDVNRKDPTMRMTEGDRVKITVYNSNSSKPVYEGIKPDDEGIFEA
jgi:FtsP/CotA-like multicopper oxidase with cupredoxin domain